MHKTLMKITINWDEINVHKIPFIFYESSSTISMDFDFCILFIEVIRIIYWIKSYDHIQQNDI